MAAQAAQGEPIVTAAGTRPAANGEPTDTAAPVSSSALKSAVLKMPEAPVASQPKQTTQAPAAVKATTAVAVRPPTKAPNVSVASAPKKSTQTPATVKATNAVAVRPHTKAPKVSIASEKFAAAKAYTAAVVGPPPKATQKKAAANISTSTSKIIPTPVPNLPKNIHFNEPPVSTKRSTAAPLSKQVNVAPAIGKISVNTTNKFTEIAVSRPGPSTVRNSAAAFEGVIRRPITTHDLDRLHKIDKEDGGWRGFNDIENEDSQSEEYDPRLEDKNWKGKEKEIAPTKRKRDSSSESSTAEEEEDDDQDDYKTIHSRPPKSTPRTSVGARPTAKPSGKFHDQQCSKCRLSLKDCEMQETGGACVSCRIYKHKCEYARPRKTLKSKPIVESEYESASENVSRPPRRAASRALSPHMST